MRNLKKILALVLALIMSLSLMATAGATDFSDADQITDDYAESVDVLNGLKVFQGYPSGDFQPQGEIKRSEVAVIIYRIATGDVDDSQVSIYKDYNKFSDVTSSHWAAGYINYCANAEYIKGRNAKTFDPEGKVTGYEALAMILRAVGYDKQGEFTGSNWHIQTAATGKQLGVTDKINSDIMLKQPATREMVAEILCKSILVPTVEYTAAFGYRDYTGSNTADKNESLGYKTFGLEYIEGVVTGNEFADLDADAPMTAGRTRLVSIDGGETITLQVKSHFGDIGESRRAYVVPAGSKSEHKMACSQLWPTSYNVKDGLGSSTSPATLAASDNVKSNITADTEYYVNYSKTNPEWTTNRRVAYLIAIDSLTTAQKIRLEDLAAVANGTTTARDNNGDGVIDAYFRWFPTGTKIPAEDCAIIASIFDWADRQGTAPGVVIPGTTIIDGEVYVGTESINDISDVMSLTEFLATYTDSELETITSNGYGNYLKVIDYDDDGDIDYVLQTVFNMDEVAGVSSTGSVFYRNANGTMKFEENTAEAYQYDEYADYDADVTPSMGDVVIWALIDGIYYTHIVPAKTATIKNMNFTDTTVTDTEDTLYHQSAVGNGTTMEGDILKMSELVEYTIYCDLFGNLRAYKAPSSRYALLTEMYPTTEQNGSYVNNVPWKTELMTSADNYPVEYSVLNAYAGGHENVFIDDWTASQVGNVLVRRNYLQNAIAHLGLNCTTTADGNFYHVTVAPNASQPSEFTWHEGESVTNVAKYTRAGDGVNLYTASELSSAGLFYGWNDVNHNDRVDVGEALYTYEARTDTLTVAAATATDVAAGYKGSKLNLDGWSRLIGRVLNDGSTLTQAIVNNFQPVYAVDYIRLAIENVTAGMRQYSVADYSRAKVDATNNTEFYIVGVNNSIRHVTGYAAVAAIAAEDIQAAYAVATNTNANNASFDYWVADVIVIELGRDFAYDAIDLAYLNTMQTTGDIKQVRALDNEADAVIQTLYPTGYDWRGQLSASSFLGGFWGRSDSATYEDGISGYLHRIGQGNYNKNGIYAGTVVDLNNVYTPGGYVAVDMTGSRLGISSSANTTHDSTVTTNYAGTAVPVYTISSAGVATEINVVDGGSGNTGNRGMVAGDHIIWVYNNAKTEVAYIVNVTRSTASWLGSEFTAIIGEQNAVVDGLEIEMLGVGNNDTLQQLVDKMRSGGLEEIAIDQANTAGDSTIVLDHSDALEGWNNGYRTITLSVVDTNVANRAIQSVTVQKRSWTGSYLNVPTTNWETVNASIEVSKHVATIDVLPTPADDMNPNKNTMWRVTVDTTINGAAQPALVYEFVRRAAQPTAELKLDTSSLGNVNAIEINAGNVITLNTEGKWSDVGTFLNCFYASNKGSIKWTFVDGYDNEYYVTADRYSRYTGVYSGIETLPGNLNDVTNAKAIIATVVNEDGSTNATQIYTLIPNPPASGDYIVVVPDPSDPTNIDVIQVVITGDGTGNYTVEVILPAGKYPHLVMATEAIQPQAQAARSMSWSDTAGNTWTGVENATGNTVTWTTTITAQSGDRFLVNTTGGGSVTPPTGDEFPQEVTVTIDGTVATVGTDYTYDAETGTLTIDTANLPEGKVIDTVKIGNTTYTYTGTDGKYILKTETNAAADVVVTLKNEGTEPTEPNVTVEWKVGAEAAPVEGTLVKAEDGSYTLTAPDGYTIESVVPTDGVTVATDKKTATVAKPTADVKLTITLKADEPTPAGELAATATPKDEPTTITVPFIHNEATHGTTGADKPTNAEILAKIQKDLPDLGIKAVVGGASKEAHKTEDASDATPLTVTLVEYFDVKVADSITAEAQHVAYVNASGKTAEGKDPVLGVNQVYIQKDDTLVKFKAVGNAISTNDKGTPAAALDPSGKDIVLVKAVTVKIENVTGLTVGVKLTEIGESYATPMAINSEYAVMVGTELAVGYTTSGATAGKIYRLAINEAGLSGEGNEVVAATANVTLGSTDAQTKPNVTVTAENVVTDTNSSNKGKLVIGVQSGYKIRFGSDGEPLDKLTDDGVDITWTGFTVDGGEYVSITAPVVAVAGSFDLAYATANDGTTTATLTVPDDFDVTADTAGTPAVALKVADDKGVITLVKAVAVTGDTTNATAVTGYKNSEVEWTGTAKALSGTALYVAVGTELTVEADADADAETIYAKVGTAGTAKYLPITDATVTPSTSANEKAKVTGYTVSDAVSFKTVELIKAFALTLPDATASSTTVADYITSVGTNLTSAHMKGTVTISSTGATTGTTVETGDYTLQITGIEVADADAEAYALVMSEMVSAGTNLTDATKVKVKTGTTPTITLVDGVLTVTATVTVS